MFTLPKFTKFTLFRMFTKFTKFTLFSIPCAGRPAPRPVDLAQGGSTKKGVPGVPGGMPAGRFPPRKERTSPSYALSCPIPYFAITSGPVSFSLSASKA
jgi:hypothetical protein